MMLMFIEICVAAVVFGISSLLCELCLEVHREIKKGNVELPFIKKEIVEDKDNG